MTRLLHPRSLIVMATVLALVALSGAILTQALKHTAQEIAQTTIPLLSHLAVLNQNRGEGVLRTILYLDAKTPEERKTYRDLVEAASSRADEQLANFRKGLTKPEGQAILNRLQVDRSAFITARRTMMDDVESGKLVDGATFYKTQLFPIFEKYVADGNDLVAYMGKEGERQSNYISVISVWTQILVALFSICLFIAGFFVGFSR